MGAASTSRSRGISTTGSRCRTQNTVIIIYGLDKCGIESTQRATPTADEMQVSAAGENYEVVVTATRARSTISEESQWFPQFKLMGGIRIEKIGIAPM